MISFPLSKLIQAAVTLACVFTLTAGAATLKPAAAGKIELRGAGSTLAAPLYEKWIDAFEKIHPNIGLNYEAVGSGEGIARFSADAVEFGASDVPLSPAEAAKLTRGAIQVPATAGMVILAYNLPGVSGQLKLPQDVYVDIFMGRIRTWDDPRIRAANPGLSLPSTNIAVIVRQDSSGTTFAFTNHLAAVSKQWTSAGLGVGKLIEWPQVAMIARGNEGVASRIKISEGSIGYVEAGFARRLRLSFALLQNKYGQFVAPTEESGTAALAASAGHDLEGLSESMANPAGPQAYPIVTYSWLLLYDDYPEQEAQAISSFVGFGLSEGQAIAAKLGYLALPPAVADLGRRALSRLK